MESFARKRMGQLRDLEPGWWGPESKVPDPALLDDLETILPFLEAHPQVGFTSNGDEGIHFEWETDDNGTRRFHALEFELEEIWYYTWTDGAADDGVEETLPYSISEVQEITERTLTP